MAAFRTFERATPSLAVLVWVPGVRRSLLRSRKDRGARTSSFTIKSKSRCAHKSGTAFAAPCAAGGGENCNNPSPFEAGDAPEALGELGFQVMDIGG